VISVSTARALAATGLAWEPSRGDRFVIPDREMDDQVFVLSDMTVETHDFPTGRVIGFNGTTEWALDSVDAESVLWLPGEGALRGLLGPALVRLEPAGLAGWAVTVAAGATSRGAEQTVVHADAEEAYALALLAVRARTARALLPLAAHAVTTRVDALAADADAGRQVWSEPAPAGGPTRLQVLARLVEEHRWTRGLLAGAPRERVGQQVAAQEDADPVAEDPAGTWRRAAAASLAAWEALPPDADDDAARTVELPSGPTPVVEHAEQVLLGLVVGAWDLAGGELDPACAAHALAHLRPRARRWREAGVIAAPVPVAEGAGEGEQLLALTGRDPAALRPGSAGPRVSP
jgi:hypothetical protein